jgi:predicted ATP-dependent serine protease
MAKAKIRYECSSCGAIHSPHGVESAPLCGEWNTIQQQLDVASVLTFLKIRSQTRL